MDDPVRQRRLVHGARFRWLPLNVRCPARCRFCYENRMAEVLPHVRTEYIPRYDAARFDEFRQMHAKACQWESDTGREPLFSILPSFERTPRGISHFPVCDLFSSGLTNAEIEELVRMREGDVFLAYAVGLSLDPEFVAYLGETYPDTFRLHLSIVTFDPAIRRDLMHPDIDVDVLRRTMTLTRNGTFFLMLFDTDQLARDVEEVLGTTEPGNGGLYLHRLHWNRASPERVVEYAKEADRHREAAVRRIAALPRDGRPIMTSLGADIQAYTRRREILPLFAGATGRADEVVFTSPGAFETIAAMFADTETLVVPMESAFGGNVDFVQGATVEGVADRLEALRAAGRDLRRVVLPDAMFWIDGACDLRGDTADTLRERFPDLTVDVVPVPPELIYSVVDIDDSLRFFDDPSRPA